MYIASAVPQHFQQMPSMDTASFVVLLLLLAVQCVVVFKITTRAEAQAGERADDAGTPAPQELVDVEAGTVTPPASPAFGEQDNEDGHTDPGGL